MCQTGPMKIQNVNGTCGCHCGLSRRFLTKKERIETLEEYQKQLELELQAVNEEIASLKSK